MLIHGLYMKEEEKETIRNAAKKIHLSFNRFIIDAALDRANKAE